MRSQFTLALVLACTFVAGCSDPGGYQVVQQVPPAPTTSAPSPSPTTTVTVTPSPGPAPTVTVSPAPTVAPSPTPTASPTGRPITPPELLPPLLAEPVRTAPNAGPVLGGTLLVTADGSTAVAADPDRDAVFLVDLAARTVRTVATGAGDQPWRVAEGAAGTLYVVARRGGAVLVIDRASASVTARIPVCNAPRGLAYAPATRQLHVACQSGLLVGIDAETHAISRKIRLDDDLRDVLAVGDALLVTRFRESELLTLDAAGNLLRRSKPDSAGTTFEAAVAFRALPHPSGSVLLAHQVESTSPVGTGAGSYYGGSCFGGGVVQQALTTLAPDGSALPPATALDGTPLPVLENNGVSQDPLLYPAQRVLPSLVGPTDLALSRDGHRIAVIATGNSWPLAQEDPTLFVSTLTDASGRPPEAFSQTTCGGVATQARYAAGEPVAVAFDAANRYVIQSREPAMLELEGDVFIPLSTDSRFDSGLALFHANSGAGIACASCHPEGTEDGHVWSFSNLGLRRTQSLAGGISRRAPFHWSGDLATFDNLFDEVMLKRMSLAVSPPQPHIDALAGFLDRIPASAAFDDLDPAAIERGRALFADATIGCATCHSGTDYADNHAYDVGTGATLITPSLRGVAVRAPFLHDGCAATLLDRFGPCGGTGHGDVRGLDAAGTNDLVAFMQSL